MEKDNILKNFFIGGFSGVVTKTLFAPFERLRIVFQTQINNKSLINKEFKGYYEIIRWIYEKQGTLSFWNGNLINIIRNFPVQALNLSLKDLFRKSLKVENIKNKNKLLLTNLFCGSWASTISVFFTYPLNVTRTVIISKINQGEKPRIISTIKEIYKQNGILKGLYKGFLLSSIGIVAYRTLHFGFYDTLKTNKSIENNILYKIFLNNLILITIGITNYPFETIVRNKMLESDNNSKINKSYIELTKFIYKEKGFVGFYRGFLINLYRSFSGGFIIVFYDEIKKFTKKNN